VTRSSPSMAPAHLARATSIDVRRLLSLWVGIWLFGGRGNCGNPRWTPRCPDAVPLSTGVKRVRRLWRNRAFRLLTFIQWSSALAVVGLGAIPKGDLSRLSIKLPTLVISALTIGQDWALLVIPLAVLAGVSKLLRERLGAPWAWELVKDVLDSIRNLTFAGEPPHDPAEFHRATLFKRQRICFTKACLALRRWPWSGWLVSVERSGHFTLKRRVAFYAPDKAAIAHGVAGRTLACGNILPIINLPDPEDESQHEEYARRTFVTASWVKETGIRARSFFGIPVEVRGKPWGVIVIDSRDPCPPTVVEDINGHLELNDRGRTLFLAIAGVMSKVLTRIKPWAIG